MFLQICKWQQGYLYSKPKILYFSKLTFFIYKKNKKRKALGGDRTHNLQLRRLTRYPLRYKGKSCLLWVSISVLSAYKADALPFELRRRSVRKGIRTPALIRGPEFSYLLPIRKQGVNLESGALDHSAILTCWTDVCFQINSLDFSENKILHHPIWGSNPGPLD